VSRGALGAFRRLLARLRRVGGEWGAREQDALPAADRPRRLRPFVGISVAWRTLSAWVGRHHSRRVAHVVSNLLATPARAVAISFLALILAGTALLSLPMATQHYERLPVTDAVFTATSASCVTGLMPRDTSDKLSAFGQGAILVLIQLGGLGIMTLSAALGVLLRRRLGVRSTLAMRWVLDLSAAQEVRQTLGAIVKTTLLAEALGAALLFLLFLRYHSVGVSLTSAAFHSVSAFCNAGFSLYADGLCRFRGDVGVNLVFSLLIIAGGLGFGVLSDLWSALRRRRRRRGFSLQSLLVLSVSAILIVSGAVLLFATEHGQHPDQEPWGTRALQAGFLSVSARTAGFSTVAVSGLAPSSLFLLILLMVVGASPGSTGGGVKTTTVAVIFGSLWSALHDRDDVTMFRRTVPRAVVRRALVMLVGYLVAAAVFLALLLASHQIRLADAAFEATSALGTVGLSTGATDSLTPFGRWLVSVAMFAGRVGPLTLAVALGTRPRRLEYVYAEESVVVG
jgi:trk system potassium uptake protein TrkH